MSDLTQDFRTLADVVEPVEVKITVKKDPSKPYIGLESMPSRGAHLLGWEPASSSISTNSVFSIGDVLFGKLRPNLRKCVIAPFDGYCSTDILVLRAKYAIDSGFAGKIFQTEQVGAAAERTAIGTKMPRTSWKHLKEVSVFCPDIEAQKRITQILDTLDTAIRKTEALIDKLKAVKQGLLHDLLTRGVDANGQLRLPQSEAPQLYKESPLGWIPREWDICPLHQQADVIDPQPDHRTPKEQEDGVPYIGIGDFDEHGRVRFSSCRRVVQGAFEKQRQRFEIEDGDIIYGKIGTIGKPKRLVAGDYALTANVLLLKPKYSPALFFMLLTSAFEGQILDITNTTSQPALGIETVRNLLVYKVPRTESDLISERLNSLFSQISEETAMLHKLKQQKSGLMDDLLTGRVRVTPLLESVQQPDGQMGA